MHPRKSSLSANRRRLVELMQRLSFGRIENLILRAGEPTWEAAPRVVREVKFGGDGARRETACADFELKAPMVEFLRELDDLGDALIESIEVKHGLPFRMVVEEVTA